MASEIILHIGYTYYSCDSWIDAKNIGRVHELFYCGILIIQ